MPQPVSGSLISAGKSVWWGIAISLNSSCRDVAYALTVQRRLEHGAAEVLGAA